MIEAVTETNRTETRVVIGAATGLWRGCAGVVTETVPGTWAET